MKKPFPSTFFVVVSCLFFSALILAQKPKCHPQDQIVVNKIQAAFGINFTGDCCDWENVITCNIDPPYRVDSFDYYNSDFSGQIPAAIGDLSSLRYVVFNNVSKLIGSIPSAITKLPNLVTLIITNTSISGNIPTFAVNKNFAKLDLSYNNLTGPIPTQLSTWLPNLPYIDLQKNKLTGPIPESFGKFPLWYLSLSHNRLTGTIPSSLGKLDPYSINLSGNRFTGDASLLFGKNKTTLYMYLHRNNFAFNLTKVEMSTDFQELQLSYNNIFGSLPQEFAQMGMLRKFNVSNNDLCGQIPQGGRLQDFKIETYSHNKCLCGSPLPACV